MRNFLGMCSHYHAQLISQLIILCPLLLTRWFANIASGYKQVFFTYDWVGKAALPDTTDILFVSLKVVGNVCPVERYTPCIFLKIFNGRRRPIEALRVIARAI